MSVRLDTICVDSRRPREIAAFWAEVLDWQLVEDEDDDEVTLRPKDGGTEMLFLPVPEEKTVKNRLHLDLSPVDCSQAEEVARLEALGARRADVGQGDDVSWVVMQDPQGNEFCVLRSLAPGEFSL